MKKKRHGNVKLKRRTVCYRQKTNKQINTKHDLFVSIKMIFLCKRDHTEAEISLSTKMPNRKVKRGIKGYCLDRVQHVSKPKGV